MVICNFSPVAVVMKSVVASKCNQCSKTNGIREKHLSCGVKPYLFVKRLERPLNSHQDFSRNGISNYEFSREFYGITDLLRLICSRLLSTSKPVAAFIRIIDTRNNSPKEIAEANNLNTAKNRLKYYLMSFFYANPKLVISIFKSRVNML